MLQIFDIGTGPTKNDNESLFPTLSYKERLMGFAFCSFLGMLCLLTRLFHIIVEYWFIYRNFRRITEQVCTNI